MLQVTRMNVFNSTIAAIPVWIRYPDINARVRQDSNWTQTKGHVLVRASNLFSFCLFILLLIY